MFHQKMASRVGEMLILVSAPAKLKRCRSARKSCAALALGLAIALSGSGQASGAVARLAPEEIAAMQDNGVVAPGAPLPLQRLRKVSFAYVDFAGIAHADGSVIVLDAVAPEVQAIFDTLLARGIALQQAQPMQNFHSDDEASMRANNSSAFNGRAMTGGSAWSKHAYGVAIDVNPRQNPYLSVAKGQRILLPPDATGYVRRQPVRPGMAETMVDIFADHGFLIWGGNWHEPIDYQHFEIGSRAFVARLLAMDTAAAQAAFSAYARAYRRCMQATPDRPACIAQIKR